MAESYVELKELSDEELIERHNCQTKNTEFIDDYYLRLLNWRIQERQTKQIKWMSVIITFATVAYLAVAIYDVFG